MTAITPADGASNVPLANPVIISFSRAINPASINGANAANVTLAGPDGTPIAASIGLSNGNRIVTLRPSAALQANITYKVSIGTGVADSTGRHLAAAVTSTFTSFDAAPPPQPPAGSITASIPGSDGFTTITATQGTAGTHDTVTIVNLTKKTTTPVLLEPNGSFSVRVAAGLADKLQIAITSRNGVQTVAAVGVFKQTNADGSVSAVVGDAGGRIEGPGGVAVDVPFHAFPDGTIVTVKPVPESQFPVQLTAEQQTRFKFAGAVSLDFGGAVPSRYVNISIPATPDTPADGHWIVSQVVNADQVPRLNAVDTAKLINGRIRTSSPPCPGVTALGVFGIHLSNQPVGISYADVYPSSVWEAAADWIAATDSSSIAPFINWITGSSRICIPVGAGRATVTENAVTVTVPAQELPLMYREVIVKNHLNEEFNFARNVVEPSFTVAGRESDTYEVVVDPTSGGLFHFFRLAPAGQGLVELTLDPDHLDKALSTVVITNVRTGQATSFPVTPENFTVKVPGGTAFQARAIAADGTVKQGITVVASPPNPASGNGNLVLRVQPGTIDPKQDELPRGNTSEAVVKVTLKSPDRPDLPIDLAHLHQGGLCSRVRWRSDPSLLPPDRL